MILTNPEHIPSNEAMKHNLSCPSGISSLNMSLFLWHHLFADQRGRLALFSGVRGDDPRRLLARAEGYFSWPDEAGTAVESALAESHRSRESYFCAQLLTEKRRIKENAAPIRALYVGDDGAYPGEGLPQPTAIIESSPGCLQMRSRLDYEVPPETEEDLNRRLLAYDTTATGYFGNRDALTSHEVRWSRLDNIVSKIARRTTSSRSLANAWIIGGGKSPRSPR